MRWADGREDPVPEAVGRLLAIEAGDRYRALRVRQSIKQIFALDQFEDVRVRVTRLDPDAVHLVFELVPARRVASLSVQQTPFGQTGALIRVLEISIGDRLPDLDSRARAAEEFLRTEGWFEALVDIRTEEVPEGIAVQAVVNAGPRDTVGGFRYEGVSEGQAIRLQRALGATPGNPVSASALATGIAEVERLLRREGYLLATADHEVLRSSAGTLEIVLRVETGPFVRLGFEGFPARSGLFDEIRRQLEENGLDEDALEAARQSLLQPLVEDGFRDARIGIAREASPEGRQLAVRFVAEPGGRFVVRSVRVTGTPPELPTGIREIIESLGDGQPYREASWNAALGAMRAALIREGYYEALVTGSPEPASEAGELVLTARMEPGPLARIATVAFEGNARYPVEEIEAAVSLAPGDPFVTEDVIAARETLQAWYRERGFLDASVTAEAPVHPESHEARVTFRILEGELLTVGRIIVTGAEVTREDFIRSRIALVEGNPLASEGLLETRRQIIATGVFAEVDVELLAPEEPVGERNVLVRVVEAPRNRIGYGAGYSQREQVRAEGEWTRSNLFGRNHTLSLFGRLSLRGTRFITTYRGAEGLDRQAPMFASAYRESQDRESFDFLRYGAGIQITRRVFGRDLILRYDFTRSELFDVKINPNEIDRDFADNLWLSTVSASVVTDTRDDPASPREGRFGIFDIAWSSSQLGSRAPFVKSLAQQFLYLPVSSRVVLALGTRLGLASTLDSDGPERVPITERFFAGGATTLRGYRLDRAGPLDESGFPLGGNMLVIANLEARIRLVGSVAGAIFSDHGGVYEQVSEFRLEDIGHNVGMGLRWDTPLGPVRFDYGLRLGDIGDASRGQWHFTIGHAF